MKLSDFGISKELSSTDSMSNTAIGTFRYMSPERLMGERYDASGDIWAVGLILIELHTGSYPFQAFCSTPVDLLDVLELNSIRGHTLSMSKGMGALVGLMLSIDPRGRRPAQDLVANEWFVGERVSALEDAQQILKLYLNEQGVAGSVGDACGASSSDSFDTGIAGAAALGVNSKLLPKAKYNRTLEDSLMAMSVSADSDRQVDESESKGEAGRYKGNKDDYDDDEKYYK